MCAFMPHSNSPPGAEATHDRQLALHVNIKRGRGIRVRASVTGLWRILEHGEWSAA